MTRTLQLIGWGGWLQSAWGGQVPPNSIHDLGNTFLESEKCRLHAQRNTKYNWLDEEGWLQSVWGGQVLPGRRSNIKCNPRKSISLQPGPTLRKKASLEGQRVMGEQGTSKGLWIVVWRPWIVACGSWLANGKSYGRRCKGNAQQFVHLFLYPTFNTKQKLLQYSFGWVYKGPMGKAQRPPWNNQRLVITAEYLLLTHLLSQVASTTGCPR